MRESFGTRVGPAGPEVFEPHKTSGHLHAVFPGSLGKFELHVELPKLCLIIRVGDWNEPQQYSRMNRKIVHTLLILFD